MTDSGGHHDRQPPAQDTDSFLVRCSASDGTTWTVGDYSTLANAEDAALFTVRDIPFAHRCSIHCMRLNGRTMTDDSGTEGQDRDAYSDTQDRDSYMIDSGENDIPPSPLELARELEQEIDHLYEWFGAVYDARMIVKQLVNALTPPPVITVPVNHEPIDWSEAAND